MLNFESLASLAQSHRSSYQTAASFPHIVFDDFLPRDVLREVLAAVSAAEVGDGWDNYDANLADGRQAQYRKHSLSNVMRMEPIVRNLLFELNSGPFLNFLRDLTGIRGLLPDPLLLGGGIHVVRPGGLLRVHADFSRHSVYGLYRRLNLLIFLNSGWKEEYGGHLELWSTDMRSCERRIAPVENRCTIFNTSSDSYHGHPHPLACPEGQSRRSLAVYYYSAARPTDQRHPTHETMWQALPGETPVPGT